MLRRGTEKARETAAQPLSEVMGAQELNYFSVEREKEGWSADIALLAGEMA